MYDIAIIGSGPGGSCAGIRLAELGAKVCIIEKEFSGGVCLNRGCIPTKAIVESLDIFGYIKRAPEFGIDVSSCHADIKGINKRKDEVVLKLRNGLEALLKSKGIELIKAEALFCNATEIDAAGTRIKAKNFIIATGSSPAEYNSLKIDHKNLLSSDDILQLNDLPKSIVIIGGGVIGCEFASIYNRLNSKVTIVELMDSLLPNEDREIAKRLEASFRKAGVDIIKGAKVSSADVKTGVKVNLENGASVEADKALLCIGRRPNISGIGLEKLGIKTDNAAICVGKDMRTNIPNIYAVGDVIGGYYLAHVASYEGVLAAENILKGPRTADYSAVPNCIFTYPQIASIGVTEEKAKASGISCSVARLPLSAVSKAHILGETEGLIKLIADKQNSRILGAHIFGTGASELISLFAMAMKGKATISEISDIIFPHPTLSESILDAVYRIK